MLPEALGNNGRETLHCEDHHEDDLDLLQQFIGVVTVIVGVGSVEGQGDARGQDGDQDEIFKKLIRGSNLRECFMRMTNAK